jgi:hypothetical protein
LHPLPWQRQWRRTVRIERLIARAAPALHRKDRHAPVDSFETGEWKAFFGIKKQLPNAHRNAAGEGPAPHARS